MLCAIAIIDTSATERLRKLRRAAERFGAPPKNTHGHITLATYIGNDEDSFISSCKTLLSCYQKFCVHYDKVTIFDASAVIVAIPRREDPLAAMQKDIARRWAADLNQWTQEDTWRPHTSLLYSRQLDLPVILKAMQDEFVPFTAQVDRIEFTHVYEDGGCEQINFLALQ